jgi:peptide/nickel transport system substrate-binding protein
MSKAARVRAERPIGRGAHPTQILPSVLGACLAVVLGAGLICGLTAALATNAALVSPPKVVLKIGVAGDAPDNLNPFAGHARSCQEIWSLNYDLLVGFSPGDYSHPQGAAATGLADHWTVSDGGRVWTFHIRSGVTWQDGVPLTAHDVAFTYNYVIKNRLANYSASTAFIKKVVAPNDNTAVFTCTRPKADMLNTDVYIVPQHIWATVPGAEAQSISQTLPIVGSGPFQLSDYQINSHAEMMANPSYWAGAPRIDEVEFIYYKSADDLRRDLASGFLQGAWGLGASQYTQLQGSRTVKPIAYVDPELDELGFNCYTGPSLGNPVLKDWKFRQALQWAVDKNKIVQIAYGGLAQPADSVLVSHLWTDPDWHWTPPADEAYHFDLAKAGQLLTAAGYPLKNGVRLNKQGKPIVLRLWTRSDSDSSQSAGKLIAGWFDKLGLKINLSMMADGAIQDGQYNMKGATFMPDYDMFLWGWGGDPDPNFILSVFTTSQINGWSDCAWSDPQYDKLFLEQQTTIDPVKRAAIVHKMEHIIYEQSPYIPTVYPESVEAYNDSGWQGWSFTPGKDGGVFFTSPVMASYLTVHPVNVVSVKRSDSPRPLPFLAIGAIVTTMAACVVVVWMRSRRAEARGTGEV